MRPARRFVYVLKNIGNGPCFYVGLTSDVEARLASHNGGQCRHTANRGVWQRYVIIEFPDEQRAIRFERYLKSGSGRAFAKRHFDLNRQLYPDVAASAVRLDSKVDAAFRNRSKITLT